MMAIMRALQMFVKREFESHWWASMDSTPNFLRPDPVPRLRQLLTQPYHMRICVDLPFWPFGKSPMDSTPWRTLESGYFI